MTLTLLRQTYKHAAKYRKQFAVDYQSVAYLMAGTVMELCMEIERLQVIADEQNAEFSDYTMMPFGAYKGKRLLDVPKDYFQWWYSKNKDRSIIILEIDHGPFAQRQSAKHKLRLHDYLKQRLASDENQRP